MEKDIDRINEYVESLPEPLKPRQQAALFRKYRETLDPAIRDELVTRNLKLAAVYVLRDFKTDKIETMDALQYASIALVKAVESYKPSYTVTFSTYACASIKNTLLNVLRDQDRRFKPDVYFYDEVPVKSHSKIEDKNCVFINMIADEDESHIESDFLSKENIKRVHEQAKKKLKPNEFKVYCALVGIGYDHPLSFEEAADVLCCTHQNVYRIRKDIQRKLRVLVKKQFNSDVLE